MKKKNLKLMMKYAKKQKKEFIIYFIFNIILTILGAIKPLIEAQQLLKLTNNLLNQLFIVSTILLIIEITKNLSAYFTYKHAQMFTKEMLKDIQIDVSKEILNIETKDIEKKSSGVFIDRITKDTQTISEIFLDLNISTTDLIMNIGIFLAIFVINKILFIYFVITMIIIFIINKLKMKKYYDLDKKFRIHHEQTTGLISELVRGAKDIKVLNAEKSFIKNIEEEITSLNKERYIRSNTRRKYDFTSSIVQKIFNYIFILLSIYLLKINNITIANIIIIYMYRNNIYELLTIITRTLELYKEFELSSERVFEILDSKSYEKEKFGKKHIKKIKGNFEFKNVNFSYDNKKQVLKNTSFKIESNKTISFVGKSGSGKSTIFSLLARLYKPDSGQILIDNINIDELDKESIRGNISIITQNPYIFNMSIKDNLKVVKRNITDKEIKKVCKLACLDEFIESLPDKYDTIVGEGGVNLSGGQKQRLAIARALIQKTKIILFDEATSALDNETQNKIQQAINNMKKDYTILIIAHRLSTVINSDKIMIIDDGKIIDQGTHKELINRNKSYKDLYNLELQKN